MNAPIPRILIEWMWRGRLFGAQWRPAIGGSLDVLEPATGAVITRVGNATAEDVRKAAAEARAAQPGWAATPYDQRAAILRKVAALMEENQAELVYWIMRETGGIEPKAGFEVQMVVEHPAPLGGHVHGAAGPAAAERRRPPFAGAPGAARRHRRDLAVQFPADPVEPRGRAGARHRQRGGAQARSAHRAHRRLHHRAPVRGSRPAQGRAAGAAGRRRGRRGDLHRSRHRHGVVHRIERGRTPHRRARRQAPQEGAARARRQERRDRARGRRSRRRRICVCLRRLVPPGPDLHDHRPRHRAREDRRRADREARRQGQASAGRRSDLRAGGARPGHQPQPRSTASTASSRIPSRPAPSCAPAAPSTVRSTGRPCSRA